MVYSFTVSTSPARERNFTTCESQPFPTNLLLLVFGRHVFNNSGDRPVILLPTYQQYVAREPSRKGFGLLGLFCSLSLQVLTNTFIRLVLSLGFQLVTDMTSNGSYFE